MTVYEFPAGAIEMLIFSLFVSKSPGKNIELVWEIIKLHAKKVKKVAKTSNH